jgi:GTP cyclohydrolase III
MRCPKEMFAEIYRQNLLLGPICKGDEAKEAFNKYEKALHELRQQLEHNTRTNECKVNPGGE